MQIPFPPYHFNASLDRRAEFVLSLALYTGADRQDQDFKIAWLCSDGQGVSRWAFSDCAMRFESLVEMTMSPLGVH